MIGDNLYVQLVDHRISSAIIFFVLLLLLRAPNRRRYFPLRLLLSLAAMCAGSFLVRYVADSLFSSVYLQALGYSLQLLVLFLLFLIAYEHTYRVTHVDALFRTTLALTIYKISWNGFKTASSLMLVSQMDAAWSQYSVAGALVSYFVYFSICILASAIYLHFTKDITLHSPLSLVIALASIFTLCQLLLEYCGHVFTGSSSALFLYYLCALLYTVINFAALVMIAMLDSFRHENRNMHDFISNKMRYYEMSHEGIVGLQTKCHDLKHQIAAIRSQAGKESFTKYLDELEDSINEYSTVIECGHPTVDIVLTEKNILCTSGKIRFSYMVDGTLFSFLTDREIYSLFGNALDNALEAASKVPEEEERSITLKTNTRGPLVVLQVENTCIGTVDLTGGLPRSTKANSNLHGFGLRSIQRLAEKHGGSMSVRQENGVFKLSVFMHPSAGESASSTAS